MKLFATVLLVISMPLAAQTPEGQKQDPGQIFLGRFDANQDGAVSLDEFKAPQIQNLEQQFAFMDKNQDAKVDSDEANQFAEEMRKRMEQMHQQGGRAPN